MPKIADFWLQKNIFNQFDSFRDRKTSFFDDFWPRTFHMLLFLFLVAEQLYKHCRVCACLLACVLLDCPKFLRIVVDRYNCLDTTNVTTTITTTTIRFGLATYLASVHVHAHNELACTANISIAHERILLKF